MKEIKPSKAFFIKLGSRGCFESECIEHDQTIRLGFNETDRVLSVSLRSGRRDTQVPVKA
jgi:hypothetical protein